MIIIVHAEKHYIPPERSQEDFFDIFEDDSRDSSELFQVL